MTLNYPAYVIKNGESDKVSGFCFLRAYNPFPVFKETAEISYFIDKEHVSQGIGQVALGRLEDDAKKLGIKTLLASISSENTKSINFHQKSGFTQCGRLSKVGQKLGRHFDIIWMQKDL